MERVALQGDRASIAEDDLGKPPLLDLRGLLRARFHAT
jgi:hypothetical protein